MGKVQAYEKEMIDYIKDLQQMGKKDCLSPKELLEKYSHTEGKLTFMFSVILDQEMSDELNKYCMDNNLPKAIVVRAAINQFFESQRKA